MNVRPARADDRQAVASLGDGLVFGALVAGDGAHLVVDDGGAVVAHGFFRRLYGPTAELGVAAAGPDRLAAATAIVRALVAQARDDGLTRLVADLDAADEAALGVIRRAGRTLETVAGGRVEVELFPGLSA